MSNENKIKHKKEIMIMARTSNTATNVVEFKNKDMESKTNLNKKVEFHILNALQSIAGAQMEVNQILQSHSLCVDEMNMRLENLGKTLDDNCNRQIVHPLYKDYIERLIGEVSRHYNIPKNQIQYEHVVGYRKNSKYDNDLSINAIHARLRRLYFLRNVENIRKEFYAELCGRIGMTEKQIREEPHAIAMYFNEGAGQIYLPEALELNKEYMRMAQDLIFETEDKYKIYDTDKEYAVELTRELKTISASMRNSYSAYAKYFKRLNEEYARLCKTTNKNARSLMFGYASRFGKVSKYYNCDFTNNFSDNIHIILNSEILSEKVPVVLLNNFAGAWNRVLMTQ